MFHVSQCGRRNSLPVDSQRGNSLGGETSIIELSGSSTSQCLLDNLVRKACGWANLLGAFPVSAIAFVSMCTFSLCTSANAAASDNAKLIRDSADDERTVVLDNGEPRPYHEINADMRAFLRREAVAKEDSDHVAAVLDLCALYEEIKRDPRLLESPTLETYRIKIRSRLMSFQGDLEKQRSRAERLAKRRGESIDTALMQQADRTTDDLANQMSLVGQTLGGPAQIFSQAGGAYGGGVGDYGSDLVNLIENTIAPEFWDTVGGPGSIMYYQPLHALVVRATSEVHHSIGGTLDALRAAGN